MKNESLIAFFIAILFGACVILVMLASNLDRRIKELEVDNVRHCKAIEGHKDCKCQHRPSRTGEATIGESR